MDFIPWPSFYERVAASLTSGEQKYQMIVTDSQWLGSFVEGGYYMDLTQVHEDDPGAARRSCRTCIRSLVSAYSTYPHKTRAQLEEAGDWPAPDTSYYGFPQFPDTYVTFYREDLFCHEGGGGVPGEVRQDAALHLRGLAGRRLGHLAGHR